ncbi:MAG: transglutaminase-like domain-containing protein [Candidatus Pacebacteria bacterium]|nr:transglutaminase-like domain-containing protein [Candidatus Paceibacterota bacterium]
MISHSSFISIKRLLFLSLLIIGILIVFLYGITALKAIKEQRIEQVVAEKKNNGINISQNFKELEILVKEKNLDKLKLKSKELKDNYEKIIQDLLDTKEYLENNNINPIIIARLDNYLNKYQSDIGEIVDNLDKAKDLKDYEGEMSSIIGINQDLISEIPLNPYPFKANNDEKVIKRQISDLKILSNSLKIGDIKLNETQSGELENILSPFFVSQNIETIPSEYLSETEEIQFTQSIKDLADSLDKDPLTILNYVRSNIDYVPYYGLKKGSDSTLIEKAGNDFDQASLLIALLRYSGYPAKYKYTRVKLSLNDTMNLLGIDDPISAAKILSNTHIPYTLYTDLNGNPLFFVLDHIYIEAYLTYDYSRGINQTDKDKTWVSMDPSLKTTYHSQLIDIIDEMNFNESVFYEKYLKGDYNNLKPIGAYKQEITFYLTANHPDLTYEDILTKSYKNKENLEFIPNTLPYEIIENISEYSQIPDNLKHKIEFKLINNNQELLSYTTNVDNIANKQIIIDYPAATQQDQDVIDLYDSIYDIIPLSIVNVKPSVKINGEIKAVGNPISLGEKETLSMRFLMPKKENNVIIDYEEDKIEKEAVSGNTEAIAINTDRIILPETRPSQDTQTNEFISSQKLYRTALDYLYRLESSHNELSQTLGAGFVNSAVRAIVFNGIEINYQNNEPYSFNWKGLRIDSSAKINYYSHFTEINKNKKRFLCLFGLESSLNESSIFEDDYDIESISTVKGLRLINQGNIPDTNVVKITKDNRYIIDTLDISQELKNKFKTSIDKGNVIYTPDKKITYHSFQGMVYIDINPNTSEGGYIIGEGLNGGYTVENFATVMMKFFAERLSNLTAEIISPTQGQVFTQGDKIYFNIHYEGNDNEACYNWYEQGVLDTSLYAIGELGLKTGYGTDKVVEVVIIERIPDDGGDDPIKISEDFNPKFIIKNTAFNNNSMTEQEIQSFLDEKGGNNPNHISKRVFDGHKVAYWIKKGADLGGINPKILLAKMQTEQGLIIGPRSISPEQEWIDWAINAGYTEDIVYARYKGFITQMVLGSQEFLRRWYDKASDFDYLLKIDINETTTDNWQPIKVLNAATFSLYKFTPHIYEGGRLVYTIYNNFFGINDLGGIIE